MRKSGFEAFGAKLGDLLPVARSGFKALEDRVGSRPPPDHVTGIPCVEQDVAAGQRDAVHVERPAIAPIESDQHCARMPGIGHQVLGANPLERRQVAGFPATQVDRMEMPVLVAATVLQVGMYLPSWNQE